MKAHVSIGICQLKQTYDFEANLAKAISMIDQAAGQGAEIAVLPEMFITPYEPASIKKAAAFSGTAIEELKQRAANHKIYIVGGSLPYRESDGKLFNRAFVFDSAGDLVFTHDKIHLFDCTPPGGPSVKESETITPGTQLNTFFTPWGEASVIVCYDIRFTPLTQVLVKKGIRMLFVPAAFSLATGNAHWEMLVRMRAVEMQGIVVGVQPAMNRDLRYVPYGHSIVASPWGDVVFKAGAGETVHVVKADISEIDRIRQMFPLLTHIRHDLYTTKWGKA